MGRYNSVAEMCWEVMRGYKGKSRKWARRRSKKALRFSKKMGPFDANMQRLIAMATPRYHKMIKRILLEDIRNGLEHIHVSRSFDIVDKGNGPEVEFRDPQTEEEKQEYLEEMHAFLRARSRATPVVDI